jgi:8-oxo-dGTP diphosphatase
VNGDDIPLVFAAHAVISDRRGRVLVLRRPGTSEFNRERWEFPGGRMEPGERIRDALVREVREETGIESEPGGLLGAGRQERREGCVVHLIFSADGRSLEVVLSEEHDAYRWVTPKGLSRLPLSDWMEAWIHSQTGEPGPPRGQ